MVSDAGGAGGESLSGTPGNDKITGSDGDDTIQGQGGSDTIFGGGGNDYIQGGGPGNPDILWANTASGDLVRIEFVDGEATSTLVGNTGVVLGDIGMAPDGNLYGVALSGGKIYQINPETGHAISTGSLPAGLNSGFMNALTFDSDGNAYTNSYVNGQASGILKFDPENPGGAKLWWKNPGGGQPSGDFVFVEGAAYLAWSGASGSTLIRLELDEDGRPLSHEVLGTLPNSAFGMSAGSDGTLYVLGSDGIYQIRPPDAPLEGGGGAIPAVLIPGGGWGSEYYGATSVVGDAADTGDLLYGDAGNDTLVGDAGNDTIYGGTGDDYAEGHDGDDKLYGGEGNDTLFADDGDDLVDGGAGNDSLGGGSGDDTIYGGAGNDTIGGDDGNDLIYGGEGDDLLMGGAGENTIYGGDGADSIHAGGGGAYYGGSGSDHFFVGPGIGYGAHFDGGEDSDNSDIDRLDLSDAGPHRIIYDTDNRENGRVEFLDDDGKVVGSITFANIEEIVTCFTPGTLICTAYGAVPVEGLVPGDMILTRDAGLQPLRWTGRRDLAPYELALRPEFTPIHIARGALGSGLPERDMMVSPQHRMLVSGPHAALLFGEQEVLVPALHLAGRPGICRATPDRAFGTAGQKVSYIHLLFDRHQIVCSDGAWSESFQPGDMSLTSLRPAQAEEIMSLFPQLAQGDFDHWLTARRSLRAHEAQALPLE